MKQITLIKLGGSVITNKDIPMSMRNGALGKLTKEIVKAKQELKNELFIVGHGQGSFAHVPAMEYQTMKGFINSESKYGMSVVLDSVRQLNNIIVHEFIKNDVSAIPVYANQCIVTKNRKPKTFFSDILFSCLQQNLLPITCGDVLFDEKMGCTIWSTEKILSFFAKQFHKKKWRVKRIIHVTEVDGFLDENKKTIETITKKSWKKIKKHLTKTKGFDVTGGMGLKIEESLSLTKLGTQSFILSGLKRNNLYNALVSKPWTGTTIH